MDVHRRLHNWYSVAGCEIETGLTGFDSKMDCVIPHSIVFKITRQKKDCGWELQICYDPVVNKDYEYKAYTRVLDI